MLDFITRMRWFQRNALRRSIFAVAAVVLAVLSLFPREQVATVVLGAQETSTAGLEAILAQLGGNSYSAFLANTLPVEVDLEIARSFDVQKSTLRHLGVNDPESSDKFQDAWKKLDDKTDVRAVRGNLIQISVSTDSARDSMTTVGAYTKAMRERLAQLSRESTDLKQSILEQRYKAAEDRLGRAKAAIEVFRAKNKLVLPDVQLSNAVGQLAGLQGQLEAARVQLNATLKFSTPQSFEARTIEAQIAALNKQISAAQERVHAAGAMTAPSIASKSLEFQALDRELSFAQALNDSYERYLEGTAIETVTANYNLREIQPPYLEPGWHFKTLPAGLFILILAFALASEFIVMRPPPGIFARGDEE
jgi:hypothetical protein